MKAIRLLGLFILASCAHEVPKPDTIRDPLNAKTEKASQCYFESDTFRDKKEITFKLTFDIDTDGVMKNEKIIEQSLKDPNFSSCFLTVIKETKFPSSTDGMNISVKQFFKFSPGVK